MPKFLIQIFAVMVFVSCSPRDNFSKIIKIDDKNYKGDVVIEKIEKLNKYKISINNSLTGKSDRIFTPYEVFQMETGDVNADGNTDICIGIIKPTPFDSVLKKRLFIFQIDRDFIRPLWLSSRLTRPLEEFRVNKDKTGKVYIRTIEKQNENLFCINDYEWKSFGMQYTSTNADSLTYSNAEKFLKN